MLSLYYELKGYKDSGVSVTDSTIPVFVNGYQINKPTYFKNKAQARAFEIALVLAEKKPSFVYTQRMGDIVITTPAPVIMTTSECIDVIMFNGVPEIQLSLDVGNPDKSARDAMKYVPDMFEATVVEFKQLKKQRKMWYLEIRRN